jgi:hypothetical protein
MTALTSAAVHLAGIGRFVVESGARRRPGSTTPIEMADLLEVCSPRWSVMVTTCCSS